jgi:hypothetical protein
MVREVRAIGYQLDRPFVVESSAFESTFGVRATPLEEALEATVEWYRTRARAPRKGRGVAFAKGVAVFTLDNVLIGLAILAVRSLVSAVPKLSVMELGIAVAAGLYWLPLLRRASIGIVRRLRPRPSPPSAAPPASVGPASPAPESSPRVPECAVSPYGRRVHGGNARAIRDIDKQVARGSEIDLRVHNQGFQPRPTVTGKFGGEDQWQTQSLMTVRGLGSDDCRRVLDDAIRVNHIAADVSAEP